MLHYAISIQDNCLMLKKKLFHFPGSPEDIINSLVFICAKGETFFLATVEAYDSDQLVRHPQCI